MSKCEWIIYVVLAMLLSVPMMGQQRNIFPAHDPEQNRATTAQVTPKSARKAVRKHWWSQLKRIQNPIRRFVGPPQFKCSALKGECVNQGGGQTAAADQTPVTGGTAIPK